MAHALAAMDLALDRIASSPLPRALKTARIVGIAGDVRAQALDRNPEPQIIIPLEIWPWLGALALMLLLVEWAVFLRGR